MFKIMSVPHSPVQEKIGHFVTRLMMRGPVRATAVGRRAYARMYLAGKHFAERAELALFRRYLRPGMTIVDMGANVGFYTAPLSRRVGPTGNVYAFEPDPFCAGLLRERARRLQLTNVLVEELALGAREGEATLFCSNRDRAENCTHALESGVPVEAIRVPVTSLDAYCRDHPIEPIDAVKMDVEGDEVSALRGMRGIMTRRPPAWMFIEFSPGQLRAAGASPEEFWEVLAGYGYLSHSIDPCGKLRLIRDTRSFTEVQAASFTNIWAVHRGQPQPGPF
jgi:FkbM family methyltransferase